MKRKFWTPFLFLVVLLVCSSSVHPIKLTASLIDYDHGAGKISIECKVFIDDFEQSINKMLSKDINVSNLTKADKAGIEAYFKPLYVITINGKKVPLKYKSSEVNTTYNVLVIKFAKQSVSIKKGDKLSVKNMLFFKEFKYAQTNRVTLHMAPFISESNHVCSVSNHSFKHTL